jgi:hypothetical protein
MNTAFWGWIWALTLAVGTALAGSAAEGEWGTVKGRIVWGGDKLPEAKTVNVNKDQDHCLSQGQIPDESLVINPKNKGIRWVFVWLAPVTAQAKMPIHPSLEHPKSKDASIDQPCCRFEPHALALQTGQELTTKNSSPIAHNINWQGGIKNAGGNVILPAGKAFTMPQLKPDRFPVKLACNIHPWMSAWVRIFDHPYYAITDKDGAFEIKLAPAGDFRLVIWQESTGYLGGAAGRNGQQITIKSNGVTDLGLLEFKP